MEETKKRTSDLGQLVINRKFKAQSKSSFWNSFIHQLSSFLKILFFFEGVGRGVILNCSRAKDYQVFVERLKKQEHQSSNKKTWY